jgi:hypothetical protein
MWGFAMKNLRIEAFQMAEVPYLFTLNVRSLFQRFQPTVMAWLPLLQEIPYSDLKDI